MAKVQIVKKARTDIYAEGKRTVDNTNKSGYSFDRSKPANKNDQIIVKKGDTYYWWQFPHGSKQISATYPKPQQLTRSEYTIFCLDIQDRISADMPDEPDELENFIDEIKSELEDHKSEIEEKLSNMPEGLQSGPTGELLQERIDSLENAISEFDSIDFSYEEFEKVEYEREEYEGDSDDEREEHEQDQDAKQNEWDLDQENQYDEHHQDWINEKIEEIQNISIGD